MFEAQLGFYKKNILEWHSRDSFFVTSAGLNIPLTNHDWQFWSNLYLGKNRVISSQEIVKQLSEIAARLE